MNLKIIKDCSFLNSISSYILILLIFVNVIFTDLICIDNIKIEDKIPFIIKKEIFIVVGLAYTMISVEDHDSLKHVHRVLVVRLIS